MRIILIYWYLLVVAGAFVRVLELTVPKNMMEPANEGNECNSGLGRLRNYDRMLRGRISRKPMEDFESAGSNISRLTGRRLETKKSRLLTAAQTRANQHAAKTADELPQPSRQLERSLPDAAVATDPLPLEADARLCQSQALRPGRRHKPSRQTAARRTCGRSCAVVYG